MIKLLGFKTKKGVFIRQEQPGYSGYLTDKLFDGNKPNPTFHKDWLTVKKVPKKIEKWKNQSNINHRYELIDESFLSDKVPAVFMKEDVTFQQDYETFWKADYKHLASLYKHVSDKQEPILVEEEFTINILAEFDGEANLEGFSYPVFSDKEDIKRFITEGNTNHSLLDKIFFPDILLALRPCNLSQQESFNIIRKHVLDNIDERYAKITSNYDFSLTVEKILKLTKPYSYLTDVGKRKRKIETRYVTDRSIRVLDISTGTHRYGSSCQSFKGDIYQDMQDTIDKYLKDLMIKINEPLVECSACSGRGVVADGKK